MRWVRARWYMVVTGILLIITLIPGWQFLTRVNEGVIERRALSRNAVIASCEAVNQLRDDILTAITTIPTQPTTTPEEARQRKISLDIFLRAIAPEDCAYLVSTGQRRKLVFEP